MGAFQRYTLTSSRPLLVPGLSRNRKLEIEMDGRGVYRELRRRWKRSISYLVLRKLLFNFREVPINSAFTARPLAKSFGG
jgi:hypothetical protein